MVFTKKHEKIRVFFSLQNPACLLAVCYMENRYESFSKHVTPAAVLDMLFVMCFLLTLRKNTTRSNKRRSKRINNSPGSCRPAYLIRNDSDNRLTKQ